MLVSRSFAHAREHSSESPSRAHRQDTATPTHGLLRLQRLVGNGAVARLLDQTAVAQRESMPEEEEELQASHDHDEIGREAPEEEEELQMKQDSALTPGVVGLEGGALPEAAEEAIDSARGGGSEVGDPIRSAVEPVLGVSMENVRVHQDLQSDALARSMTAKAFTTGTDVFLRSDQNAGDQHLMAHELAHVAQQAEGGGAGIGGRMTVGAADDPAEMEADRVADAVASGGHDEQVEEA